MSLIGTTITRAGKIWECFEFDLYEMTKLVLSSDASELQR